MSSRVAGAGLALIAVALLAVSIATPTVLPAQLSLFAGHPTVAGHVRETQDVYVGFYAARLCNSGGDGTCKSADAATTAYRMAGYAELALTGLLAGIAVALALLTLRKSEQRKTFAALVWSVGALALAGAGALILLGPFHDASAPLGIGMALHGAGIVLAMLAGVLARRRPPPIRLRVAERSSQPVTALPTAQALGMRPPQATPRPAPAAYPAMGSMGSMGSSEGDPSSDPFGAAYHTGDRLPFATSQLRPLYEVPPVQGGTGGLLPIERPAMPAHPPAPIPRAALNPAPGMPLSLPFGAGEYRSMPRPMPADEPTAMGPQVAPVPADEPVAMGVPFAIEELTPMAPPPVVEELRPAGKTLPPPTPALRAKPPSTPPLPPQAVAPQEPPRAAPAGKTGSKPRTQISLVPPMPDNDLPIAPPTAQIAADPGPEPHATELALFPRAETPLAPPPAPVAAAPPPPRERRESQLPPPLRGKEPTRPPLKAAVPMPERATRSAPSPTRPPPIAPRIPPPRPTVATAVPPIPPIPAIPLIPPIPSPPIRRAETDVTDPEGRADTSSDADPNTVSRVPIEVGDYISQTNVSVSVPSPEEIDAAVAGAGSDGRTGGVLDTSPSGEPVATDHARDAMASAAAIASRPTVVMPEQQLPIMPIAVAPPISPVVRDRPMPKLPISTAPDSLPPPRDNKQASGPSPACPQCEAPMAWVEEHLRFYCKSCRMYF
jgi:hypothetical protein